jgi:hypothetical protein
MPLTKSSAMSFAGTLTLLPSLTSVQILFFAFFCWCITGRRNILARIYHIPIPNGVSATVAAGRGNIAASKGYDELSLIRQAHYHPMLAKDCLNCYDLGQWSSVG